MKTLKAVFACAALVLLPAGIGTAAEQAAPAPAARPNVDADAMAALDKMGEALRAHNTVVVKAEVTTEDVLASGQKLQYAGTVEIYGQRPDRLRVSQVSDVKNRQFFYDGKAVTVYSPRLGMYASFPAPATIRETLQKASEEYGVEFPLADLFAWGTDKSATQRVTSAFLVRPEKIGGQTCNHYALRQENVDWQVWIAENGIPCKLVITNRADPAMPQYTAVLHWSFPATIASNVFAFAPPANSRKIVIAKLDGSLVGGTKP